LKQLRLFALFCVLCFSLFFAYTAPNAFSETEKTEATPEQHDADEAKKPEDQQHPPELQKPEEQPKQPELQKPGEQPRPENLQRVPPQRPRARVPGAGTRSTPTSSGVSFFFDDANLNDVIQTVFGEILKVNYIIDPKVQGRVNFRTTTPIPNADVLFVVEIILRINGATVVEDKGIYKIIPIGTIPKEPTNINFGRLPQDIDVKGKAVVQIIPVQYASSTEMVQILTPFLSQGAVVQDIQRKNCLIIADTDVNIKKMLRIVEEFDKDTDQIQVYTYPLQSITTEVAMKMITPLFLTAGRTGKPLVTPGTNMFADENSNSIIILATPRDYRFIDETMKKIDLMPSQVLIEAVVAQVTLNDTLHFGVDWFLKTHFDIKNKPVTGNLFGSGKNPLKTLAMDATAGLAGKAGGLTFFALDASNTVRGVIEALENTTKVKVLSSPNILATNNKEAKILIGKQVPIVTSDLTSTTVASTGTAGIQRTIQYKDTGNILKVKPQIKDGGLVTLEVSTEVSTADRATDAGLDTTTISKTEVSTTLIASDNQTILMGGFIQNNSSNSRGGIPFLSKIPLLGYFFGASDDTFDRTELIVLLTPHIIKNRIAMDTVTEDFINKVNQLQKAFDLKKSPVPKS